jgi:hypothetical protein
VGPLAGRGSVGGPGIGAPHSPRDRGDWPKHNQCTVLQCNVM